MGTKWSDYCISAVRYNTMRTHIDAVWVHQHFGEYLDAGSLWTRLQVVGAIERGFTFSTVTRGSNGNWYQGPPVEIVVVGSQKFLRTDRNQYTTDNLGELPELPTQSQAARY